MQLDELDEYELLVLVGQHSDDLIFAVTESELKPVESGSECARIVRRLESVVTEYQKKVSSGSKVTKLRPRLVKPPIS
jgi:hypothetical protein